MRLETLLVKQRLFDDSLPLLGAQRIEIRAVSECLTEHHPTVPTVSCCQGAYLAGWGRVALYLGSQLLDTTLTLQASS